MTDVGRRDAMAIASLLSDTPRANNDESTDRESAPAKRPDKTPPQHLPSELRAVLPSDPAAAAAIRELEARFLSISAHYSALGELPRRIEQIAEAAREEADLFVASAYPQLMAQAEVRAKQSKISVSSSPPSTHTTPTGSVSKGKNGKSRATQQADASSDSIRSKARKSRKKGEVEFVPFVPIAPAKGSRGPAKEEPVKVTASKRKRKDEKVADFGKSSVPEKKPKKEKAESADDSKKEIQAELRREKQYKSAYDGVWRDIARKEIPKVHKLYVIGKTVKLSNCRKTATLAAKEARKWQVKTNRHVKDMQTKARRAMREMMSYWKRNEKEERDSRKKAEKEAIDSARKHEEEREALRQSRKLNFLITQTELYSHFVGSKSGQKTADADPTKCVSAGASLDFDNADDAALRAAAEANAQSAVEKARNKASQFDDPAKAKIGLSSVNGDMDAPADSEDGFRNPVSLGDKVLKQPKLLSCILKEYQIKGLTWLANLYEQGINGILADEMGLGKTVQSISVMAYLAEVHNIWGPFLVVAPASTLHNWQQEITKFVPEFKVLPYWGSNKDRKVLRKFWDRKQLRYTKDSPFHVLVTSYQLIVADAQYFNRIKWQYMILDEAQAIKSSSSSRWKSLLSMQCRNRLLLTGTPIQNSMQELWALLHFIMPTLFDSHEEFSDWFSKDIESHATKNKELNENQLKRLHMILKPFMLRRVKKHVQQELGDKIEIDVYCSLTPRQKLLYRLVKSQISIRDLIERGASGDDQASLMNLVMQFRKVCNHPDLFERQDVLSAYSFADFGDTNDFLRETNDLNLAETARNPVSLELPKLFSSDSGIISIPGHGSNQSLKKKTLSMFRIVDDPASEYVKSIEAFSGTPAGEIVRAARRGMLERVLEDAPQILQMNPKSAVPLLNGDVAENYLVDNYIRVFDPAFHERVTAPPILLSIPDRYFHLTQQASFKPPTDLFPLTLNEEWRRYQAGVPIPPISLPENGRAGYTTISVPSMAKFIADSGKLKKLDELLVQLKKDDHRVLVYFQMTKMMDLMEEYLTYRQYKYLRLDGSSKLGDRRDLVNDWQTRPDLFVFLLSTRAGGLGINLTAADTVVFFDSDWNPTIDSQAMDRAHRLGQTRQVTVYRLLVKGTIEERMRNRAKQKEQVQTVVMEGSKAAKEQANKSSVEGSSSYGSDVAFWLLDDNEGEGVNL